MLSPILHPFQMMNPLICTTNPYDLYPPDSKHGLYLKFFIFICPKTQKVGKEYTFNNQSATQPLECLNHQLAFNADISPALTQRTICSWIVVIIVTWDHHASFCFIIWKQFFIGPRKEHSVQKLQLKVRRVE